MTLVPDTTDPDHAGFWEAARRGRLAVRACRACGTVLHLPRPYCRTCGGWDVAWRPVAGTGTLYSWTVARHAGHPAFPPPYTIVLVDLDAPPGVRFAGHLPGAPELEAGMPMRAVFRPIDGTDVVLPQWEPA